MTTIAQGVFAGKTIAELELRRNALQDALLLGRKRLVIGGDVQEYNSLDDMRAVISDINTAIAVANGDTSMTRATHGVMFHRGRFK